MGKYSFMQGGDLFSICQVCFFNRLQGPPGTGKTRTILGLLSIILHAAPAHSAGLIRRAQPQPMPEFSRQDAHRLWLQAAPWLSGAAHPRCLPLLLRLSVCRCYAPVCRFASWISYGRVPCLEKRTGCESVRHWSRAFPKHSCRACTSCQHYRMPDALGLESLSGTQICNPGHIFLEHIFVTWQDTQESHRCGIVCCRDEVVRWNEGAPGYAFGLLDVQPPVRVGKAVGPKAHVLVCAPSNSALDEIVSRLLQSGLLDWWVPCSWCRATRQ